MIAEKLISWAGTVAAIYAILVATYLASCLVVGRLNRRIAAAKIQALMQNTGEEIPYREGAEVAVHLPATALRILEDTGARLASAED